MLSSRHCRWGIREESCCDPRKSLRNSSLPRCFSSCASTCKRGLSAARCHLNTPPSAYCVPAAYLSWFLRCFSECFIPFFVLRENRQILVMAYGLKSGVRVLIASGWNANPQLAKASAGMRL